MAFRINIHECQLHPKVAIYVVKQLKNDSFRQGLYKPCNQNFQPQRPFLWFVAIRFIVPCCCPLESGKFPGVFGARVLGHLTKSPANWHCRDSLHRHQPYWTFTESSCVFWKQVFFRQARKMMGPFARTLYVFVWFFLFLNAAVTTTFSELFLFLTIQVV